MRRLLVGASLLMVASSALAAPRHKKKKPKPDDTTDTDKPKGDEIEMGGDASPPPTADHIPVAVVTTPTEAPLAWPLQIDDRPLTLAKAKLELHGSLPIMVLTVPGAMPNTTTSTTSEGLAFGASYGVDDKLEIGGDYAISLHPGSIKGPLAFHGAYRLLHDAKLEVAVAAALVADFIDATNPTTMMTTTTSYVGLQLGAWVRYHVAPKLSVFTGLPALPHSSVSLSKQAFALPPLAYQLAIGFNNQGAIALDLPVGVGLQATPKVYAFAALNLANIRIANTANAFLFRDFIPVAIGGFYSLDKLDVGAVFADDLKQAGSYLRFEVVARYFVK